MLTIQDGGELEVSSSGELTGGTISSIGSGIVEGHGGLIEEVLNLGSIVLPNSENLSIAGNLTNDGTLAVNSTGSATSLVVMDAVTLDGSGTLAFSDNENGNRLIGGDSFFGSNGIADLLTIGADQRITGSFTVDVPLILNGTLSPGTSPGAVILNEATTLGNSANLIMEIMGSPQSQRDQVIANDGLTLGGTLTLDIDPVFLSTLTSADEFEIIDANSTIAGSFNDVLPGERVVGSNGATFKVEYGAGAADPTSVMLMEFESVSQDASDSITSISGIAEGGTVTIVVDGVEFTITTSPGDTSEDVAVALAAAINGVFPGQARVIDNVLELTGLTVEQFTTTDTGLVLGITTGMFALGVLPADGTTVAGPGDNGNAFYTLASIGGTSGLDFFTFTIDSGVFPSTSYLSISTEDAGSPDSIDTRIFLFDADGIVVAQDNDDGSGLYSQLSFGSGDPLRIEGSPGDDGQVLATGDYTLVVGAAGTVLSGGSLFIDDLVAGSDTGDYQLSVSLRSDPAIELANTDPSTGDRAGFAVSIDGDWAAVGVRLDDRSGQADAGSVEIYRRDAFGEWVHHQTLLGQDISEDGRAHFGHSVNLRGELLVVGAETASSTVFRKGSAERYAFQASSGLWVRTHAFEGTGGRGGLYGRAVAINPSLLVVSELGADVVGNNSGAIHVLESENPEMCILCDLVGSDTAPGDGFGGAVALDGSYIVAGAFRNDPEGVSNAGAAYVYYYDGSTVIEVAKLQRPSADLKVNDQFGRAVSISGNLIAVGARLADTNFSTSDQVGKVFIFEGSDSGVGYNDTWTLIQTLGASDASAGDRFGTSLELEGNDLIVGAPDKEADDAVNSSGNFPGQDVGRAYLYTLDTLSQTFGNERVLFNEQTTTRDEFGTGVALDETSGTALVGAWLDNRGANNSGSAYIFEYSDGTFP